ncbi:hypothetical protein TNCV_4124811 [Trichonephila clavipes]|nr:hypothetical protein TNCV_4124811 [Trichonephila clavipes]
MNCEPSSKTCPDMASVPLCHSFEDCPFTVQKIPSQKATPIQLARYGIIPEAQKSNAYSIIINLEIYWKFNSTTFLTVPMLKFYFITSGSNGLEIRNTIYTNCILRFK